MSRLYILRSRHITLEYAINYSMIAFLWCTFVLSRVNSCLVLCLLTAVTGNVLSLLCSQTLISSLPPLSVCVACLLFTWVRSWRATETLYAWTSSNPASIVWLGVLSELDLILLQVLEGLALSSAFWKIWSRLTLFCGLKCDHSFFSFSLPLREPSLTLVLTSEYSLGGIGSHCDGHSSIFSFWKPICLTYGWCFFFNSYSLLSPFTASVFNT